jgi:RNase P subunit RPR2
MAEYSQSWRKKMRIKQLVEIAQYELKSENYDEKYIERIREKLDSEMKARWKLIRNTRKDYLEIVEKILRKEYVLNV